MTAAKADWTEVDPSIFGTLLEQALDVKERSKLGAHYTPRAYVERLVIATIMEPLRADWNAVKSTAERQKLEGDADAAIQTVRDFNDQLYNTRVLDPACGTGNFLYVSLELMKRLEGEVLEALADLGGQEALRGLDRHEVDPHQFLGLELNHRARHIAELVLWIGFLQWHKRNRGELPGDPVLRDYGNIRQGDAVLIWDGYPVPKIVDGKETLPKARRPDWPEAEFIVGNPPFIGGKDVRSKLGDTYVETLWGVHCMDERQRRFRHVLVGPGGGNIDAQGHKAAPLRAGDHQFDHAGVPAPRRRTASDCQDSTVAGDGDRRPSVDQGH